MVCHAASSEAPSLPEITIWTEHDEDMGIVTLRMQGPQGECITSFHFSIPWPKEAYHSGTHWLPEQCSTVDWLRQGDLHHFSTS